MNKRKKKYNKYKNKKITLDGHKFDSKKEAMYYLKLKDMQERGEITALELQPRFIVQEGFSYNGKKERAISYVSDFKYEKDFDTYVVDVKGYKTDVYKLKRKLFLYKYDYIKFIEV